MLARPFSFIQLDKFDIICDMKEIALYRKYRPQKFKDVLGQDHIVKVLEYRFIKNKN